MGIPNALEPAEGRQSNAQQYTAQQTPHPSAPSAYTRSQSDYPPGYGVTSSCPQPSGHFNETWNNPQQWVTSHEVQYQSNNTTSSACVYTQSPWSQSTPSSGQGFQAPQSSNNWLSSQGTYPQDPRIFWNANSNNTGYTNPVNTGVTGVQSYGVGNSGQTDPTSRIFEQGGGSQQPQYNFPVNNSSNHHSSSQAGAGDYGYLQTPLAQYPIQDPPYEEPPPTYEESCAKFGQGQAYPQQTQVSPESYRLAETQYPQNDHETIESTGFFRHPEMFTRY